MFGPALATGEAGRPAPAREAGAAAQAVLEGILRRGAREGVFAIDLEAPRDLAMGVLAVWSLVHGQTVLVIDGLTKWIEGTVELTEELMGWLTGLGPGQHPGPNLRDPRAECKFRQWPGTWY